MAKAIFGMIGEKAALSLAILDLFVIMLASLSILGLIYILAEKSE